MRNRFTNADQVWNGGACNPRAVARALTEAIDEAVSAGLAEGKDGLEAARDPAVQMILDHLCYLCGLPQPSLDMGGARWSEVMEAVRKGQPKPAPKLMVGAQHP